MPETDAFWNKTFDEIMPLIWVMRLVGKAPSVWSFTRQTLEEEIRAAGFVELAHPDVGAEPTIAFMTARKPR